MNWKLKYRGLRWYAWTAAVFVQMLNLALGCPIDGNQNLPITEFRNCNVKRIPGDRLEVACTIGLSATMQVLQITLTGDLKATFIMEADGIQSDFPAGKSNRTLCLTLKRLKLSKVNDLDSVDYNNRFKILEHFNSFLSNMGKLEMDMGFRKKLTVGYVDDVNKTCITKRNLAAEACTVDVNAFQNSLYQRIDVPRTSTDNVKESVAVLTFIKELYITEYDGFFKFVSLSSTNKYEGYPTFLSQVLGLLGNAEVHSLSLTESGFTKNTLDYYERIPRLNNITQLDLSKCSLTRMGMYSFRGVLGIKSLILRDNNFDKFPDAVALLSDLIFLDFSGNVPFDSSEFLKSAKVLQYNGNLVNLSLDGVDLTTNGVRALNAVRGLVRLSIRGCSLQTLGSEGIFYNFSKLEFLFLSNNNLTTVEKGSLLGLINLQHLDLSANLLTFDLPDEAFWPLTNLKAIDFTGNKIDALPVHLLKQHPSVTQLHLSNNEITSWSEPSLNFANALQRMDLSSNKIVEVTQAMTEDFDQLDELKLADNRFDCSACSLPNFQNWLRNGKKVNITDVLSEKHPYECSFPSPKAGLNLLEVHLDKDELRLCRALDIALMAGTAVLVALVFVAALAIVGYNYRYQLHFAGFLVLRFFPKKKKDDADNRLVHDLFVSFCQADIEWVTNELLVHLEEGEQPYKLCVHQRDFLPGLFIRNQILDNIDASRRSLFVLTSEFIKSVWCSWELKMVHHKLFEDGSDILVLIQLERLDINDMPKSLRHLVKTHACLHWPTDPRGYPLFWARLRRILGPPIGNYVRDENRLLEVGL